MSKKTTTITIDQETMKVLKIRAIERGVRYSDYLEELIRDAWDREDRAVNEGNPTAERPNVFDG